MQKYSSLSLFTRLLSITAFSVFASHLGAADSTWSSTATSSDWTASGNWTTGVPGSASGSTSTDVATFNSNSSVLTINPDASRNLRSILFDTGAGAYTFTGGTFVLTGSGSITMNAGVTASQNINSSILLSPTATAYTFTNRSTTSAAKLNLGGSITGQQTAGNTTTLNLGSGSTDVNGGTISGVIGDGVSGGKVAISKPNGANTWSLSGANTYTGSTTVAGGSLTVMNSSALGAGGAGSETIITAGRLQLANGISVANEIATISGTPAGGVTNSGLLYVSSGASASWGGDIKLNNGTGATARIGADGILTIGGSIMDAAGKVGNLDIQTATGTSKVVLSGASTYTGTTNIVRGQLQLAGGDNRLPVGTILNVLSTNGTTASDTGTFDLNGVNQTLAGLTRTGTGGRAATVTNTSATSVTLTVNQSSNLTYGTVGTGTSTITGNLGLTKSGTGTLTLIGANTYTGATNVKGGALVVTGSLSSSGTMVIGDAASLISTAKLLGHGSVGDVTLGAAAGNTGASIDPGNSLNTTGVLSTGTFTQNSGSKLEIQIGGANVGTGSLADGYDRIATSGNVSLSGDLEVSLLNAFSPDPNSLFFVVVNGGAAGIGGAGQFSGLAQNSIFMVGSESFQISYSADFGSNAFTGGNDIALMAIPEPSAMMMFPAGVALFFGLRRFRKPSR